MNVGWSKDNAIAGMLCPSKIHMLNFKAPCDSGKRLVYEGEALMYRANALIKETPEISLVPSSI